MSAAQATVPAIVIGATGYVGGEFLRLIAGHPVLALRTAVSESKAGHPIAMQFPHLAGSLGNARFDDIDTMLGAVRELDRVAVFSAAPHGAAAAVIDRVLEVAETAGTTVHVVDASADFRYDDADAWAAVYGGEHGARGRLAQFTSAVPEHFHGVPDGHIGHPGCFATAMQLAIVPLLAGGLVQPRFFASGVTGATGAGKAPAATTHTPERHSNLFAYKALSHRHAPEVVRHVAAATGITPALHFVPHSGPFSRGIHMTVFASLVDGIDGARLRDAFEAYYRDRPFVRIVETMPRVKSVVASNYADIGIASADGAVSVTVVIDNLVKGAAGGCVQWMNRLLGLPETCGLEAAAPGWT